MDFVTPRYNQLFFEPENCHDSTSAYNSESLYIQNTQCQPQQYYNNGHGPLILDDGMMMGNWEHSDFLQKQAPYPEYSGDMAPQYYSNPEPSLNEYHDLYSPTFESEGVIASTDSSPFFEQRYLLSDRSSPITPSGSPLDFNVPVPNMYLVDDQYNYDAYHVPMMPDYAPDGYLGFLALQQSLSPFTSPESIPSLSVSPVVTREDVGDSEVAEPEEDGEEDEDERSVLPNCGNTELHGMGLYDDKPDRMYASSSFFSSNSHKPAGKGLVLEQSFGLPKQMTMNQEEAEEEDSQLDDENERWQQPHEYQQTSFMY